MDKDPIDQKMEVIRLVMNDDLEAALYLLMDMTKPKIEDLKPLTKREFDLASDSRIEAIKAYRSRTGCNLRAAKTAVDFAMGYQL